MNKWNKGAHREKSWKIQRQEVESNKWPIRDIIYKMKQEITKQKTQILTDNMTQS